MTKLFFHRLALAVGILIASIGVVPAPAQADAPDVIRVVGHGLGHGRGLGQYGALGYALDDGWTYEQILAHYYSNTTFGEAVPNDDILVWLQANDDQALTITSASPFSVGGHDFAGGEAARVAVLGVDSFEISRAPSCTGAFAVDASGVAGAPGRGDHPFVEAVPSVSEQGDSLDDMLVLCGANRAYRGALRLVEKGGLSFIINRLPLESYLRGVVPQEVAAFWGELGDGAGMEALKAQAVAARSYALALAASRSAAPGGFASDTCDTQSCQVYGGAWLDGLPLDNGVTRATTTQAIADTAGQVRRHDDQRIAFTEFASSTGGWTAPLSEGNAFPAVIDEGDDVARNPNDDWEMSIKRTDIEERWPSIGTLERIEVTARNGLGEDGGRVRGLRIVGSAGTVDIKITNWANDVFRKSFGLKSDWYRFPDFEDAVGGEPDDGDGFWVVRSDGTVLAFGDSVHYGDMAGSVLAAPIVSMTPTASGRGYWLVASDGGVFAFGDAEFQGSAGAIDLDEPIVDMAVTPNGRGYWLAAADGGIFAYGDARFRGSMGGTALREPVVGMNPTGTGAGYWLVASDGGVFAFGDAVFRGSTGSIDLDEPITSMSATPTGRGYWFVASDGGVFAFGDARFLGSRSGRENRGPVVAMAATSSGLGYWLVSDSGTSFPFGDAPDFVSSIAGSGVVDVVVLPQAAG